jgi:hypothetical protein
MRPHGRGWHIARAGNGRTTGGIPLGAIAVFIAPRDPGDCAAVALDVYLYVLEISECSRNSPSPSMPTSMTACTA